MYFDSENILENKLIILFALSQFNIPMTKEQITQIILENVQISYFDIQFLIENLKTDAFIYEMSEAGVSYYSISEPGRSTLKLFESRIPTYIKEIITMFISQNKDKVLRQVKYQSSYVKQSDGEFIVNLVLLENEVSLIDIKLNVVNKNQAEFVCSNWEKNGDKLYTQLINTLIHE
ncbi:uncharacterized protein DUF4364 [Alkalibaculum bacchi]|uniref:Uncharacterized protein DUF4364 n=1 Tax=Alkalibaculum bacchi TaxID=645887 RepID=A0A366I860_9FIRM|nr:DUF4364 family protein [Alkalibaculum bacchi]RBP63854.1 uncharacterized protein DUF4364 [Alkalibaculum bacchi]